VGGTLALLGVGLVYGWAEAGDHEREIERLRQVAIEAEQRAEQAEATALTNAAAALQQEREAVQALQADAAQSIQLAESRRQAATRAIAEVDQRVALITQERDEAKRKAANATATIRRHQAKAVAK
jgi:chromosome segregation ATPase